MLFDAQDKTKAGDTLPSKDTSVDVCIIGSGAAGLTIAHELIGSGKSVIVLESSRVSERKKVSSKHLEALSRFGLPHPKPPWEHRFEDPTVQPVYKGKSDTAEPDSDDFFLNQRVRVYGGTTNCWGGWTRPLAADLDFNRARANPDWRWPIEAQDLADGYSRAMEYCSLGKREASAYDDPAFWVGKTVDDIAPLAPTDKLRTAVFTEMYGTSSDAMLDGRWDFQLVWGPAVEEATQITIYRNANVTGFSYGSLSIDKVRAWTVVDGKPGHEFFVKAKVFVLAASCIENARLLLLSDAGVPNSLGPALGKYLFTHPMVFNAATFQVGEIDKDEKRRAAIQRFYTGRAKLKQPADHQPAVFAVFAPTPVAARDNNIGNFRAVVGFGKKDERNERTGTVNFAWEQFASSATTDNRIYLENDDKLPEHYDMFGCLKARAMLKLADTDTLVKGLDMLREGLEARGVAVKGTWQATGEDIYLPGAHAMGTTRMSAVIDNGVVNKDCRAHNIYNLYIAGNSVFPTGGYSNPTLTTIALAIRLADHLKTL